MIFPNAPKSWWAIIVPWALTLSILYFDFMQPEVYRTNPVIIFSIPILLSLIFMRNESFEQIVKSFGLDMPTWRDKAVNIIAVLLGIVVGFAIYEYITLGMSVIPLYFIPLASTGITSLFMLYMVVAVGEEVMTLQYGKIAANKLNEDYGFTEKQSIFNGIVIARAFWSSMHWFSYQGYVGIENLPLFIVAWGFGMIFSTLSIGLAMLNNRKYLLLASVSAHFCYDLLVSMYVANIINPSTFTTIVKF